MNQIEIIQYCDEFLEVDNYSDYCPNGLQVEGDGRKVKKIVIGVSISLDLIEKAIREQADLIITHHGLFWNKEERLSRFIYGKIEDGLGRVCNGEVAECFRKPFARRLQADRLNTMTSVTLSALPRLRSKSGEFLEALTQGSPAKKPAVLEPPPGPCCNCYKLFGL